MDPFEPPYNRLERVARELGVQEADVLRHEQFRTEDALFIRVDIEVLGIGASYLSSEPGCYAPIDPSSVSPRGQFPMQSYDRRASMFSRYINK